jgi:hypothetical protein
MSDASSAVKNLRDRLAGSGEDRLGRALSDLLENPLLSGAIGHAFDAREKAAQAQEVAMGALNIPSAADIERLTRRLRSVSQRLEGIEDGLYRMEGALSLGGLQARLTVIEEQLAVLTSRLTESPEMSTRAKTDARPETMTADASARPQTATAEANTRPEASTRPQTTTAKGTTRAKTGARPQTATGEASARPEASTSAEASTRPRSAGSAPNAAVKEEPEGPAANAKPTRAVKPRPTRAARPRKT